MERLKQTEPLEITDVYLGAIADAYYIALHHKITVLEAASSNTLAITEAIIGIRVLESLLGQVGCSHLIEKIKTLIRKNELERLIAS